jgi:LysM repeat protein
MSPNLQSRWIGPIALGAAVLAVLFVITTSVGGGDTEPAAPGPTAEEQQEAAGTETGTAAETGTGTGTGTGTTETGPQSETYRVRPGDTLGTISERTGVSVEDLQELNPDIDPQTLTVGQRIQLTE